MDLAQEISEAISQPIAFGADFDDAELDAELELLQSQQIEEKYLDVGMPSVPATIPKISMPPRPVGKQVEDEEDAELAELKASMAM